MLGLGPLEPLLQDDLITDIMVNGPERVFVERRGKLDLSGVRFASGMPPMSASGSQLCRAPNRREHADGGRKAAGRFPRQYRVSATGARGPYISIRKFSRLGSTSPG